VDFGVDGRIRQKSPHAPCDSGPGGDGVVQPFWAMGVLRIAIEIKGMACKNKNKK
jgi:hypothetical protein